MANKNTYIDLSEVFKGLENMLEAKEPIARAMALAMGTTVRDEAKIRAPVLAPGSEGYDHQRPYVLRDAIYVAYDARHQLLASNEFRYGVSWNSKKAPHGHLMEFGFEQPYEVAISDSSGLWYTPLSGDKGARRRNKGILRQGGPLRIDPHPFLGPAYDSKLRTLLGVAIEAGRKKFSEVLP